MHVLYITWTHYIIIIYSLYYMCVYVEVYRCFYTYMYVCVHCQLMWICRICSYSRVAYCDVTGRESRLPLRVKSQGVGPLLMFSFDTLDIQNVFINSAHAYEVCTTLCTYRTQYMSAAGTMQTGMVYSLLVRANMLKTVPLSLLSELMHTCIAWTYMYMCVCVNTCILWPFGWTLSAGDFGQQRRH